MLKSLIRHLFNLLIGAWGKNVGRDYDIKKTIIIACPGRGGSTWLAELIATIGGYPIIWEPLHLGTNPECIKYGFTWNTYLTIHDDDPIKKQYLQKVLTGKYLSDQLVHRSNFNIWDYIHFKGFLIKFTTANLLLPWLLQQFPVRAILMTRHPCAAVASQLKFRAWDHVNKKNITFPKKLGEDFPHLREIFKRIKTREETLAFEWAFQTYVPLIQPKPYPWLLTTYERIVERGKQEIDRIFNYLREAPSRTTYQRLNIFSSTATNNRRPGQKKIDLASWKNELSAHQIRAILSVTHDAGIDLYDENPGYNKKKFDVLTGKDSLSE